MIKKFVDRFTDKQNELRKVFAAGHPESYEDVVKAVVSVLSDENEYYQNPDPDRIHVIDDGDYQGTLVFVIAETGYQPSAYWATVVGYGSCSGCDTLQAIRGYEEELPDDKQISDYMTLALHIVQNMKALSEDWFED